MNQAADMTSPAKLAARTLFAEFGIRMAAFVLDIYLVLFLATSAVTYVLEPIGLYVLDHRLVTVALFVVYLSLFWSSPMRATPVQYLFGMRVIDEEGETLSFRSAVLRGLILTGLFAGASTIFGRLAYPYLDVVALPAIALLFLAAMTPNRQALHDLLAHSVVVNKKALKSQEYWDQLREYVANADAAPRKKRRPSIFSIIGNAFVLGVPIFGILTFLAIEKDRNLRFRTMYAVNQTATMKIAVEEFYLYNSRWPENAAEAVVAARVDYPDGGYFELEDDGVIRIQFTAKPELMSGSIVLSPTPVEEGIRWECHVDGDIASNYLMSACRG